MKCYMFDVFGITQYYIVYAITCIGLQILTLSDYKLSKHETRKIFASCYSLKLSKITYLTRDLIITNIFYTFAFAS